MGSIKQLAPKHFDSDPDENPDIQRTQPIDAISGPVQGTAKTEERSPNDFSMYVTKDMLKESLDEVHQDINEIKENNKSFGIDIEKIRQSQKKHKKKLKRLGLRGQETA